MVMKAILEAKPADSSDAPAVADSWQKLAESRVGQVIGGRMTLQRVLGIGGTATVYAARHRNGRALAVKVLHPEYAHHTAIRQRFLAEGYAANKVDHPDAVAILDEGEDADGTVFIVMELLRGRTVLERLLAGGPLPLTAVVSIAQRVLSVLAQAHDRGVVHRDVKPSNIFETDEGRTLLLDFGIARVQDGDTAFLTRPGSTLGTPAFMAPELAAGRLEELDALTDLWAVGATMFQLLTAEVVHPSRNDNELLVLAATEPARSLAALRPDLDAQLVSVVDRALAFQRKDRWPNARAMSSALAAASERLGGHVGSPARTPVLELTATAPEMAMPASRPPPAPRAGSRWAVVALLALAGAGVMLATRYAARMDVQAKYNTPTQVPVSAAAPPPAAEAPSSVAREALADLGARSAPIASPTVTVARVPGGVNIASKSTVTTHPSASAHPSSPSAANTAAHNKNPLFFPTQ